jgi:PAS domain S-box-containing protein
VRISLEHKVIAYASGGALLLWVVDAGIDAVVFKDGNFLGSLLFDLSPHEMYFRSLMIFGFFVFGIVFSRIIAKRRQVEKKYEDLVELSSDIISISDKHGKFLFMNDAGYRLLERTPQEVLGRPFTDLLHPDDREKTLKIHRDMVERIVETDNLQNRYITKNGKIIPTLHNVRALQSYTGEFVGAQWIARDITKLKESEEELKRAIARAEDEKARSESILSAISDGISIQDRDLKVIYQNMSQKMLTSDSVGQLCHQAYARAEDACPSCPILEVFKDGKIHTIEKTIETDGAMKTLEIKASPFADSTGAIIAGIEVVRDITERKKSEQQLKFYSAAIEEAIDGIQIVSLDGVIIYSNKAIREIYGYSPEELIGKNVNEMNSDKEYASRVIIPRILQDGRWSGELMVVHKSGKSFPIWLATSLVKDDMGKPMALVGIIRDVTERKHADEVLKRHHEQLIKIVDERTSELTLANESLRREIADRERMEQELLKTQKLESIGILAGGIAHDFNNLLASIMGNVSLAMLDLNPSSDAYRQLDAAERASLRAQDLTRQLLTFSKGGTPVKKITVISDLIREASGFAIRGSRVRCDFSFTNDLWLAEVDEGQISQAIHNLVINADHAMPDGGTITIRCDNIVVGPRSGLPLIAGDYVRISIHDCGIGISKEHLPKIFDPYFTTKQKGSGLGLATTYSIIKKHNGHIIAESALGQGTTFIVYLPASSTAKLSKKQDDERILIGSGKILIMDDDKEVRSTTGDVLRRLGYTVEFATDGVLAIELYRNAYMSKEPFDAVIMDLTVPGGMGGKEALVRILDIDPNAIAIVSSGYSNDPIMAEYKAFGFKGMVTKPYRIRDIGETLHRLLRGNDSPPRNN